MNITPDPITDLATDQIFVFGSNQSGSHGAGAAFTALKWGAEQGIGEGLCGATYALPTKDFSIRTRTLYEIAISVVNLLECIYDNPQYHFLITKVGCGLAGYNPKDIAPMFHQFIDLPNCSLPQEFITILTGEEND